jgi:hypothetical protein
VSARRYLAPVDIATGVSSYQPHGRQTQPGWHLDRNFKHNESGFIDAPDCLPRGGTRALDSGEEFTVGISHVWRERTFA